MTNPVKIFKVGKSLVKVFRGDTNNKIKNFSMKDFYKQNPVLEYFDKQSMGKKFKDITKKRNTAKGRWFTTDKEAAKSYKDKTGGVLLEAEISKKDLILGSKMKNKFFKDVETDDATILLPRKNLKDVVESKKDGGFIHTKSTQEKYYKDIL
jgi:hypothetical protein